MKLYAAKMSPYARKCLIMIHKKGLPVEVLDFENMGARGYEPGVNPAGKIPALVRDGLPALFDSPVICEYLDGVQGSQWLLPRGEGRFAQMRQHALGDSLADAAYNYRYEIVRPEGLHWAEMIERHETAIIEIVKALDAEVVELGDNWDYGNLAIIAALGYVDIRAGHLNWQKHAPALAAWREPFLQDPAYTATQPEV